MNNKQLNSLVISYQESRDERIFDMIHEVVSEKWERERILYSLARKYQVDIAEVESLANFLLYDKVETYKDEGNFYNLLAVSISRRCINLRRDNANHIENEISLDASIKSEDEDDNPLINFLVRANAEEEAVELLQRKRDQRQLISELLDKAPDKSREAIKAYVESDFSFPAAAKLLGVKYDTVKRRVEKVGSFFDANRNGKITDYYTIPTHRTA